MRYLGGKSRIADDLCAFLQPVVDGATAYTEPFIGGANVVTRIRHAHRYASDINAHLITMWRAVQGGWKPPDGLSRDEYAILRMHKPDGPLTAFAGFGCSFGGKWFGGYANDNRGRNYASNARNSILAKRSGLEGVELSCGDYREAPYFRGGVVYCDPPYAGTTTYAGTPPFNTEQFWQDMRALARDGARVFVSEYTGPEFARVVWHRETTTAMRTADGKWAPRTEKLFEVLP